MSPDRAKSRNKKWLWLLLGLSSVSVTSLYMHKVLLPWEYYFNVQAGTLKAALGDLYSPWFGARALLLQAKNPYGPEVTHDIQIAFYGHDVQQTPGNRPVDEQRFAYPVYVVFLFRPWLSLSFDALQRIVPLFLALAVAGAVQFWISALRLRAFTIWSWSVTLFILASPQVAQGLRLRQLGMLVAFLIAVAVWLIVHNKLVSAGCILALSTIKPQMVVLPIAAFLLWTLGDFRRRWAVTASFLGSTAVLIIAGEYVLPGWLHYFMGGLSAYRVYGPTTTLLQLALGRNMGIAVSVALVALAILWAWIHRKVAADSPEFMSVTAVVMMGAALALPLMPSFNQVLLILPVILLLKSWPELSKVSRWTFAGFVSWPWITSILLLVLRVQPNTTHSIPLIPSALTLLFPLLLPILLMGRSSRPHPTLDRDALWAERTP